MPIHDLILVQPRSETLGTRLILVKMTNESKGPRTKMLLVYVGATDSSDQPKIKYKDNKLQG